LFLSLLRLNSCSGDPFLGFVVFLSLHKQKLAIKVIIGTEVFLESSRACGKFLRVISPRKNNSW